MDLSLITRHKKPIIIGSISVVVITLAVFSTLLLIQKTERIREAEIVAQVSDFQDRTVEKYEYFAIALNSLATDIYHDGENIIPLTNEKINQYVEKLDALEVPDDTLVAIISNYRVAWHTLKDNFDAQKYDETKASLAEIQNLAKETSDRINSEIDALISAQISAYEQSLRDERP